MGSRKTTRLGRTAKAATVMLAFLVVAACGRSSSNSEPVTTGSSSTPVILISIDTLRADRLPAYGYDAVATPHLDRFRRDSILFRNLFAHSPLTLPSHSTMLTGALPAQTGVRDNVGYFMSRDLPTLPEMLKKNGYETGAAVSTYALRNETGIGRGFDFYSDDIDVPHLDAGLGRIQRPGAETIEIAKKWIVEREGKPFFFLLHLYEPHTPYEPPEPFRSRYQNAYDGEVAAADELVGQFLEFLRTSGLYDRAAIIVTSDHGEGLFDHGEEEHGIFLYREAIHVPFFMKLPNGARAGEEVRQTAGLADITPTVLEMTSTSAGSSRFAGSSLLTSSQTATPRSIYSETYYPRFHFGWSDLHSLTDGRFHYIHGPEPEIYDMAADPGEKRNVASEQRRQLTRMREAVTALRVDAAEPSQVDPEQAAKLAALGYLGHAASSPGDQSLPDPKREISIFPKMQQAFQTFRDGRYAEAIREFDVLLARNRLLLDVWEGKSRALQRLGRHEEAISVAKEALALSPRSTNLAISVAVMSMELGRLEEARRHAELAIGSFPAPARDLLARIAMLEGDLSTAEREARLALDAKPDRPNTLVTLGSIEMQRGNFEGAVGYLNRAGMQLLERKKQPIPGLHFLRGDSLARLGYEVEAERAFRLEMKLFPSDPRAYRGLLLLYLAQGREREALALGKFFIKTVPGPRPYAILADAMRMDGNQRASRAWLQEGLRKYPNDGLLRKIERGEAIPVPAGPGSTGSR